MPQQQRWPNIRTIVDETKQAVGAASNGAEKANKTIQNIFLPEAVQAIENAIQTVARTVQADLTDVLHQAHIFDNHMQSAIDRFLHEVQKNPQLLNFQHVAILTLNAADASFTPFVSTLSVSTDTVQNILKDSGFIDLSQNVGGALTQAMVPINETRSTLQKLTQIVLGLSKKVFKSAGNISTEIDNDLKLIKKELHERVKEVNTTFIDKTNEGYNLLVDHLRSAIEDVLPVEHLYQAVYSLNSLAPVVNNFTHHVAHPLQNIKIGFDEAVNRIRKAVPSYACSALGFGVFFLISICSSLIAL